MNLPDTWRLVDALHSSTVLIKDGKGDVGRLVYSTLTQTWSAEATMRTPPRQWPTSGGAGTMMLMGRCDVKYVGDFHTREAALEAVIAAHVTHRLETA